MALVHVDNLAPGMVVTQNVCDRSGRMLLPAGSALTDRHFSILRMWGVLEVEVLADSDSESPAPPAGEEIDPVLREAARGEVERLFRHNDPRHPAVKELMRICIDRRASRAS